LADTRDVESLHNARGGELVYIVWQVKKGIPAATMILWLAASLLAVATGGLASARPHRSDKVQQLKSECEQGKYAS
jgi:hypothetical protein